MGHIHCNVHVLSLEVNHEIIFNFTHSSFHDFDICSGLSISF